MNRRTTESTRRLQRLAALVLTAALFGGPTAADDASAARAVELYDAARYAEARQVLEQLDAEGQAGGALLYRLYYCQRATGDAALGTETLRRAVERLEQEVESGADLEAGFYLASGYDNSGRQQEAREVVSAVLARVESGEIEAVSGVDRFRLGKLYADQGNEIEAASWYRSSILAFGDEGSGNSAYIVWASRYLADQALEMQDYSAAEMHLTDLVEHGRPTAEDLDRLAVARVRNGMYAEAAEAWRKAIPLNPGMANRARYCARLALMAKPRGMVETAPSGQPWSTVTEAELDELMKAQVRIAREVQAEALQTEDLSEERRTELRKTIKQAKKLFATAGLEFALAGYDIREAAFLGGYAPMVFQSREWSLRPAGSETLKPATSSSESGQAEGGGEPGKPE